MTRQSLKMLLKKKFEITIEIYRILCSSLQNFHSISLSQSMRKRRDLIGRDSHVRDVQPPLFVNQIILPESNFEMASTLSEPRDYKYIAEKYSQINDMQVEFGKTLVVLLDLKHGQKVLDMGCGTGELTSFTASQVGEEGEVLGIDPDRERITVAVPKHCGAKKNIKFMVGDSSSHFPHYNEEYYDVHFSNLVFHWLTTEEKDVYFKAAFNCLKPGGRIAINSLEKNIEIFMRVEELLPDEEIEKNRPPYNIVEKKVAESMLENSGFTILSSELVKHEYLFPSLDYYIAWYYASSYTDLSKVLPHKKEAFAKKFVNDDGTVHLKVDFYRIIASKLTHNSELTF